MLTGLEHAELRKAIAERHGDPLDPSWRPWEFVGARAGDLEPENPHAYVCVTTLACSRCQRRLGAFTHAPAGVKAPLLCAHCAANRAAIARDFVRDVLREAGGA